MSTSKTDTAPSNIIWKSDQIRSDRRLSNDVRDIWMCALAWLVTTSVESGDVAP